MNGFDIDDMDFLSNSIPLDDFGMDTGPKSEVYQSPNLSIDDMIVVETRDPSKYTIGQYFENSQIIGKIIHISSEKKELIVHVEKNKSGKGLTAKRFRD